MQKTTPDSPELRVAGPVTTSLMMAASTFAFLILAGAVCAAFATALNSGGHTGSEMSLLAHDMNLRSVLAIFLAIGGAISVFFGLSLNLKKRAGVLLVVVGFVLCLLSSYTLFGVYEDFDALETASRCGTYDRYC